MNSSSLLRLQGERIQTSSQPSPTVHASVLNLLKIVAGDTSLVSDFSQIWVMREFQLGDELTSYSLDKQTEDNSKVLYLICSGRVRVLGFNVIGREVSTQLLVAQQTFGADDLFCHQALPYRAIAASAGLVAQVPISHLIPWLQQIRHLSDYLQKMAGDRQTLIFFKTLTELRSLQSHSLKQMLPYLGQNKISAGLSLMETTPPSEGRYWLASGNIQSESAETPSPLVGESWGYPELTLPAWSTQTDILVYCLPREYWESATAIAKEIPNKSQQARDKETVSVHKQQTQRKTLSLIKLPPRQPPSELPESPAINENALPPASEYADVEFLQLSQKRWSKASLWRRIPFIQQQSSSDCGAACLAMVSLYWGKRFSLNTLRNLALTDRTGASLPALADAAETLGYRVLSVRASISKLALHHPWIAHWQGIHYVVVWQVKGDRLLISDPAVGRRWLSRQEFEANWTGYALLLSPTERLSAKKSEKISRSPIWQTFWRHRYPIGQIIVASVLLQVFGLATPLITQVVLDRVMPYKSLATLNVFAFGFLIFGMWHIILTAVRQHLLDYFSNRMDLTLISGFISHTLRLPLQFFASRQVGDIVSRVQENRKIQLFLTRKAVGTSLDAVMSVVYLGLMAHYNLQLTFLMVGLILPIVTLTLVTSPFLKGVSRDIFKKSAEQNSSIVEMITGVVTVKTAAAEQRVRWRWEHRFQKMVKARFRGQKLANNLHLASSLIHHIGSTIVLWYGATLVIRGEMSIGEFVAFNLLIGNVINPVLALVGLWDEFQEILISIERLDDVLTAQPEENPQKQRQTLPPIRGEVYFENVSFRYSQNEPRNSLQNISFKVKAGQTVGIVGKSGSGKSTLVNLLAGLYRPSTGRILIDGHDTADVSCQSLRCQLGIVPQECFLFSGTVLENITLYNSEYTLELAMAAAKLADAHDFIQALPLGYNTQVGERGMMLSGGQRQRIAIARALIKNPQILILDEATSSLDTESENTFQQKIARFSRVVATSDESRTTFIIAHRLSTVANADYIIVLDSGIVVEQGNHDELMTTSGLYSHLVEQQLHF